MTADDVFVTRGSQMALALVARALLRPGDIVAVERIGYRPACVSSGRSDCRAGPGGPTASTSTRSGHSRGTRRAARGLRHASPVSDDRDVEGGQASCASLARAPSDSRSSRTTTITSSTTTGVRCYRWPAPIRRESSSTSGRSPRSSHPASASATSSRRRLWVESVGAIRSLLDIQGDLATEGCRRADRGRRTAAACRARPARVCEPARDSGGSPAPGVWRLRRCHGAWRGHGAVGSPAHVGGARGVASAKRRARVSWYPGRRYAFDGRPCPMHDSALPA